ncbi:MAG: arylsulfatase [Planctomycetota bacterium]
MVIILADDLGAGDLGAYNADSKIPTPSLDRLAREGVRFLDAHAASSVCSPTRYGLLTGRYAWRTRLSRGVLDGNSRALIDADTPTLASAFADAGYRTACFGKWHLGLGAFDAARPDAKADYSRVFDSGPHTLGFARSRIIPASLDMPPYAWVTDGQVEVLPTEHLEAGKRRWSGGEGFWRAGPSSPGFVIGDALHSIASDAVDFIENRASTESPPFLLYVPLTAPHTPWVPDSEHVGRSRAGWYGDFVAQVDTEVGRILTALESSGARDDTIVVLLSDNGAHWRPEDVANFEHDSHLGRRGMKADIHEAGHRVPMILRWPGHTPPNSTSGALVSSVDLFATLAELCGVALPKSAAEDSVSFAACAIDPSAAAREDLVLHSLDGTFALRAGDWVMIEGLGSGGFTVPVRKAPQPGEPEVQLFDLAGDPAQRNDRSRDEPVRIARMRTRLASIRSGSPTSAR